MEEKDIRSINDLREFMLRVVKQEVPSPLYAYNPLEEENSDNYWWTEDNESYQLLIKLNEIGLITINSQDGKYEDGDIGEGRSYVHFLMEMTPENLRNLYNLSDDGYLVHESRYWNKNWTSRSNTIRLCRSLTRTNCDAYTSNEIPDSSIFGSFDQMKSNVKRELRNNLMLVCIADPVWIRPATHLFRRIFDDFQR